MRDVFISYSRKDKPFVERLHQALEAQNRDTWVDWDDIPLTAEWWQEIQRGIEAANTFVFVISPDSLASQVCGREIDHATQHNKRLIPIVYRAIDGLAVHPALQPMQWIFFQDPERFESQLQRLLTEMDRDLDYVRSHTRYELRAIEWQNQKRNESFGLKGDELRAAETWLSQGETKEPKPTELQQNYIRASRSTEDANEEARQILVRAEQQAKEQLAKAKDEMALIQHGIRLEREALALLCLPAHEYCQVEILIVAMEIGRSLKELLQRIEARKTIDTYRNSLRVLRTAVNSVLQKAEFRGNNPRFSPDGKQVITCDSHMSRLYDLLGSQLAQFQGRYSEFNPNGGQILVSNVLMSWLYDLSGNQLAQFQGGNPQFSSDGQRVLTEGFIEDDSMSWLYDLSGNQLAQFQGGNPQFSSDGQRVLTASFILTGGFIEDGSTSWLYDLSGNQLAQLRGTSPRFSPDGEQVITQQFFKRLTYDLLGNQLAELTFGGKKTLAENDSKNQVYSSPANQLAQSLAISHTFISNSKHVLIDDEGMSRLYDLTSGKLKIPLANRNISSADGRLILISDCGSSWLYNLSGKQLARFQGDFSKFINNDNLVLTESDSTAMLYDLSGNQLAQCQKANSKFSPDGEKILMWDDSTSQLYDLSGKRLAEFQGGNSHFSDDGKYVFTEWENDTNLLYDLAGNCIAQFEQFCFWFLSANGKQILAQDGSTSDLYDLLSGNQLAQFPERNSQFSLDGEQVLAWDDGSTRLYDLSGNQLAQFQGLNPCFSPDGRQIVTKDGNISRLYDLSGNQLAQFQGIFSCFNPGQPSVLVTYLNEDITRLHDLAGNLLAEYSGSTSSQDYEKYEYLRLGFTQDGTQILTLTSDGTLRVWDIDKGLTVDGGLDDLLRRGCEQLKNFRNREEVRRVCPDG